MSLLIQTNIFKNEIRHTLEIFTLISVQKIIQLLIKIKIILKILYKYLYYSFICTRSSVNLISKLTMILCFNTLNLFRICL